jgi:predicted nucleic acid-binding protein
MRSVVIDTSALLAVLLEEPTRPALIAATEGCSLVGPPTLPWEVGNALIAGVRRKRLSPEDVRRAWVGYRRIPVRLVAIDLAEALELSLALGAYAYDGYVLQTARSERLPLMTLDRGLIRAAQRLGLPLMEVAA